MTLQELKMFAVLGHLAIGILAVVMMFAAGSLVRFVEKRRITRMGALPSPRAEANRFVDHRQVVGRVRC